jgi:ABC-type antimicrobial peptide transport system permease subunit
MFSSNPEQLRSLAAWLVEQEAEEVVMESTAQYWKPVWEALEGYWKPVRESTIDDQRDISLLQERLLASLGTMFGVLALTLAGVGLFGLLSFFVTSRTSEIGIRMALGAERRDVGWLVIREILVLVGAGLLIGLPLSYATVRVLSSQLYGVGQVPIIAFGLSVALLLSVAGIVTVIPVRRATALDPMVALRYE